MKILLIDDELTTIQVYIQELTLIGHQIVHVRKLDELNASIESNKPFDWIILDVMMPIGKYLCTIKTRGGLESGIELVPILKEALPGINITVLTNADKPIFEKAKLLVGGRAFKKFEDIEPTEEESLAKLFMEI